MTEVGIFQNFQNENIGETARTCAHSHIGSNMCRIVYNINSICRLKMQEV